jgi:hypothetical protein
MIKDIQNMMRELVIAAVEKHNIRIHNGNDVYNSGIAHAYSSVLNLLYNQAKLFHIPLHYLSLHTMDPEKACLSNEILSFDKNIQISEVSEKYKSSVEGWLLDNNLLIKERYEDCLHDITKDEFYKAVIDGYKEIFSIMKKYGIKII